MKNVSVAKLFIVILLGTLCAGTPSRAGETLNLWCAGYEGLTQQQDGDVGYVDVPLGTETHLSAGSYAVSLEWDDNLDPNVGFIHHTGRYLYFTVDDSGEVIYTDTVGVGPSFDGSRAAWEGDHAANHHSETRWAAYFNGQLLQELNYIRRGTIIGLPNILTPDGYAQNYVEYFHLKPQGRCDACTSGLCNADTSAADNSLDYTVNLGRDRLNDQATANQLGMSTKVPFPELATPSGLSMNFANVNGNETIYAADNSPRQVVGPQTMANITVINTFKYQIQLYPATAKGTKDPTSGLYAPTGAPTKTITIENPDNSVTTYNRLHITESTGDGSAAGQRDYLFTYTGKYPQYDPSGQWDLVSQGGVRQENLESHLIDPSNPNDRLETRTISDQTGKIVSQVQRQYHMYTWGEEITSETIDPNGAALTTTYDYWHVDVPDPNNPPPDPYRNWANHIKQKIEPNGHWETYQYDSLDRPTKTVVQFQDAPFNAPDNQCRVTTTSYIDTTPLMQTEVETLLGVEVSRRYTRYLGQGQQQEIVCQAPGAAWNDANNLVTTTVTDTNGNVLSTQRPDGTLTLYSESVNNGAKTTVTTTGAPSADGSAVVDGTQTTTVMDGGGNQLMQTVVDVASGLPLSSAATTQADVWGRPTRVVYADGSSELTGYDCCGVSSRTDRDGVTTTYTNDAFSRVMSASRAGITTIYTYDAVGRKLTTVRQGSDQSTITLERLAYDVAGRQISRTDALGHVTASTETIDPATGHTVRTTTLPDDAHSTRIETSVQDGSLLSVGGTAAHPLLYAYGADAAAGAWRQEIRVGDGGAASEWTMTYTDPAGRDYKTLTAGGAVTQSFYNAQGQLTRSVDPDGVTTLYGYNARGEQDTAAIDMDRNGQIDFAGIDRIDRMTRSVVQAHGTVVVRITTSAWTLNGTDAPAILAINDQSVDGRSSWHTDAAGLITSSVTSSDGVGTSTTMFTAPDGSYKIGVTQAGRSVSQTRYDANAQTLSGTTMDYYPQGRVWHQTDLRDGVTTFVYDNGDQLRSVSHAGQTTGYDYDALGRKTLETQPDNGQVQTLYWPTGEVQSVGGVRTYPQSYTYDNQGRLKTLTTHGAAGAEVTTWNYDAKSGHMLFKAYADGKGPSYIYTPAGRLATRTWARGIVTMYGYDSAGQLVSTTYSDGATPPAGYTYDRLGRLVTASGGGSVRVLSYQGNTSLVTSETYTAGPLSDLSVKTGYDGLLRRAGLQVNQAQTSLFTQSFGFDAASRLANASQGAAMAAYNYDPNSEANLVQSIVFSNNGIGNSSAQPVMTTTKTYDLLDRLTGISSTVAGASMPVSGYGYTYNAANQRVRADIAADGTHWLYGYDALGQVMNANRQWSDNSGVAGQQFGYGYDQIGNRTSTTTNGRQSIYTSNLLNQYGQRTVPGAVDVIGVAAPSATVTLNQQPVARQSGGYFASTATANNGPGAVDVPINVTAVKPGADIGSGSGNALATQQGGVFLPQTPEVFAYDADGNLTQDGHWTYTWDGEDRLVGLETLGNLPVAEHKKLAFGYDDTGRRVQKQVWTWNVTSNTYQAITNLLFAYDRWNLVTEMDGVNLALLRSYLWGIDLDGGTHGAGGVGGLLILQDNTPTSSQETYMVAADGEGSVTALVQLQTGATCAQYSYGVFGELIRCTENISRANALRFNCRYQDAETCLCYYGYRYYNYQVGSWINRDPIEDEGGSNLYGFISNDAINTFDCLGLSDINIVLTRDYSGYFNTYGHITMSSSDSEGQCCGLPKTWLTLELPWYEDPYPLRVGSNPKNWRDHNQTLVPVRSNPSHPAHLDPTATHTTPTALNGQVPPSQPAGMESSDYNAAINSSFNTGNGKINVHAGTGSWDSLGCIIIGNTYVDEVVPPPQNRSTLPFVDPEALGTAYIAYGFDYNDSLNAQVKFNALIACMQRKLGRAPTISFKLSSLEPPPWHGVLLPPLAISQ